MRLELRFNLGYKLTIIRKVLPLQNLEVRWREVGKVKVMRKYFVTIIVTFSLGKMHIVNLAVVLEANFFSQNATPFYLL